MKIRKCFFCNQLVHTPIQITEIDEGQVTSVDLCAQCGKEYMEALEQQPVMAAPSEELNMAQITTAEELVELLTNAENVLFPKKHPDKKPCDCGMTLQKFDENGKFGCAKCYEHFDDIVEQVVIPYHKADQHTGKRPKHQIQKMLDTPEEQLKILKLRLAQAIELEEYEKAAVYNQQIKEITQPPPATSSDQ